MSIQSKIFQALSELQSTQQRCLKDRFVFEIIEIEIAIIEIEMSLDINIGIASTVA